MKAKKLNVQIAMESKLNCYCCKDAFSPKSECTLVYCYVCYLEKGVLRTGVHDSSEKGGQGRKRVRRNGGVAKITEVGEHLYKGECGKHTLDDVDSLKNETDSRYLLRKRPKKLKGKKNIAETCWGCGGTL